MRGIYNIHVLVNETSLAEMSKKHPGVCYFAPNHKSSIDDYVAYGDRGGPSTESELHLGDLSRRELTVAHSSASYLSRQNHMTAAGQIFTTLSCTDDVAKDAWSKYKTRDRSSSSLCGPRHQLKCLLKCAGSLTSTKRE